MPKVAAPKQRQRTRRASEHDMPRRSPPPLDAGFLHRVGLRIKQRRLELGMTQAQLARAIDRCRSLIAEYEAGRKAIPHPTLGHIARALRMRVDALFQEVRETPRRTTPMKAR
jgi:DNA-binding XRE family transcriptional regulator